MLILIIQPPRASEMTVTGVCVCVSARAGAAGQRGITRRHNAQLKARAFDVTVCVVYQKKMNLHNCSYKFVI